MVETMLILVILLHIEDHDIMEYDSSTDHGDQISFSTGFCSEPKK